MCVWSEQDLPSPEALRFPKTSPYRVQEEMADLRTGERALIE